MLSTTLVIGSGDAPAMRRGTSDASVYELCAGDEAKEQRLQRRQRKRRLGVVRHRSSEWLMRNRVGVSASQRRAAVGNTRQSRSIGLRAS